MADRDLRDPYEWTHELMDRLVDAGLATPLSGRQMGIAAVCAAGMLVALGVEPRVRGEATHPDVFRGRALVDLVGDWRAAPTGLAEGGGRDAC